MKVYFYIKPKELEYLSKILKEKYNKYQAEPIEISFNPKLMIRQWYLYYGLISYI